MSQYAITRDGDMVQVEDDVAHVVGEIRRLWPELDVQYVERPELGDAPYRIIERCKDGAIREVMPVWVLNNQVLDILHQADSHKHDVFQIITKHNDSLKRQREAVQRDWSEAAKDVLRSRATSRLGRWTFPDIRPGHEGEIVMSDNDPARRTVVPE